MQEKRPSPDAVLKNLQANEEKQGRGRLKIFFGACAGVGKTFTMLHAAQTLRAQHVNVVVGLIETHGRPETEALLQGLSILPRKKIAYHDKLLDEFDLDAAIKSPATVVLVDELAHSNIPGSRHKKRWQDVEELLDAGIDVYSTLNVQHLESLTDVVSQITTVHVQETIPDRVFDNADEVVLVDLPTEELLQRLHEGKIYLTGQIRQAVKNFFRKGNLIALRELALRRMADRVDVQMREYRSDKAIERIWQAKEQLLVCVGPGETGEKLIRRGYRLANSLRANWLAVYVETPKLQKLSKKQRSQILKNLRLAHALGANVKILAGSHRIEAIISYAHDRNVTKIIVGKSRRGKFSRLFRPTLFDQLTESISDIDIYVVGCQEEAEVTEKPSVATAIGLETAAATKSRLSGYLFAAILCGAISACSFLFSNIFSVISIAMFYLLGVLMIAIYYGRGPSIFASFITTIAFGFFFVPFQLSIATQDLQHLLIFGVMLLTALTITHLTASLRYQARIAIYRERRTHAISSLSKELSTALSLPQIIDISSQHLHNGFQTKMAFFLPNAQNKVYSVTEHIAPSIILLNADLALAQWVFDHKQPAGLGTQTLAGSPILYLPLIAPMGIRGVVALLPGKTSELFLPEQQDMLDALTSQIASSLEHMHYVEVARNALLTMEIERLRNAILDEISHELDKPIHSIMNLSQQLIADVTVPEKIAMIVPLLYERTEQLQRLIANLLDMARLQTGKMALNKREINLNEIIQAAIQECKVLLIQHSLMVEIPPDFPKVCADPILLQRVFYQLFENAGKFTPLGSQIIISAEEREQAIIVSVQDNGPGFPKGMEKTLFEKFTRVEKQPETGGVGLGLAICRAIIEAHEGQIFAENVLPHGAKFTFQIPFALR